MIKVCGCNNSHQLGEDSNNRSPSGFLSIRPPVKSHLDPSSILSLSIYSDHLVIITKDGSLYGIGDNNDNRISSSLPKNQISQLTKFTIKDKEGHSYTPISAVCGETYTLFLVSNPDTPDQFQLAYSYLYPKDEFPLFLNIGNLNPVSLFGSRWDSAAIDSEGSILFIPESLPENPTAEIERIFLNETEKAVNIVICDTFIVALSLSGKVFISPFPENCKINFVISDELKDEKIKMISGTYNHCLAVTDDGRVFGIGSNKYGKIGIGKDEEEVKKFVEIETLKSKYKIKSAFAGNTHSLFVTEEGKVLSCGTNDFGQLLLDSDLLCTFEPVETTINEGVSHCVAGDSISVVFVDCEAPEHSPNLTVKKFSIE